MERETFGLDPNDLFGDLHIEDDKTGSLPLGEMKIERPEALDHHLQILRDWIFNKVGVLISYLEMGDSIIFQDSLVQNILRSAPDEVLTEDAGGVTYAEKIGGKIDSRVLDYIEYAKKEIVFIFSHLHSSEAQTREIKSIIDEVRGFHTLEDMPSKSELENRRLLAA